MNILARAAAAACGRPARPLLFTSILLVGGCQASYRPSDSFHQASVDYADSLADVENHQLLLNIARLANNEPAHFVEVGSFSAAFAYGQSFSPLGTGSGFTRNYGASTSPFSGYTSGWPPSATSGVPSLLPSLGSAATALSSIAIAPSATITYSNAPSFNFTPITGDGATKAIFSPLNSAVFSRVFSGWHADAAIRTAVQVVVITPTRYRTAYSNSSVLTVSDGNVIHPKYPPHPDDNLTVAAMGLQVAVSPEAASTGKNGNITLGATVAPVRDPEGQTSSLTCQWQVSKDGGATWDNVGDNYDADAEAKTVDASASLMPTPTSASATPVGTGAADKAKKDDGPKPPFFFGAETLELNIRKATDAMDGWRFRCQLTQTRPNKKPLFLFNDPRDPGYSVFLALAFEVSSAQHAGVIPAPYKSALDKIDMARRLKLARADSIRVYKMKTTDVLAADAANWDIENADSPGEHAFAVYKDPDSADNVIGKVPPDEALLKDYPLLHWFVLNDAQVTVSLRSFDTILYEVAKEEPRFLEAAGEHSRAGLDRVLAQVAALSYDGVWNSRLCPRVSIISVPKAFESDQFGDSFDVGVSNGDPDAKEETFTARPILRLTRYRPSYTLLSVTHKLGQGLQTYTIGDMDPPPHAPYDYDTVTPSIRNETEFTLLSYLFSQSSIDSSKLPVQQLVQIR